jgi:hypothetical protein
MPRPIPGSSYSAADVALYKALALLLKDAAITPLNALQLLHGLATRSDATPGQVLEYIGSVLPAFAVLKEAVASDPTAVQRAERMLTTLLSGIATGRSQSGFLTVAPAVHAATASKS